MIETLLRPACWSLLWLLFDDCWYVHSVYLPNSSHFLCALLFFRLQNDRLIAVMPSRRSSVRSRISSHRQQPIQPQVYDEEESNQVPDEELVPVQAKRSHRSSKKPVKSSSNHKRRRRQRSESSEEPDQLSDYGHSSNETSSSEEEDEEGDLGSEEYEETESVGEDDPRKRTFIPRDRDPVYIQNRSFPPLLLPPSSDDLLIPSELVLPAFGIYEILRRFAQSLQVK